jgi:hypothetical protein
MSDLEALHIVLSMPAPDAGSPYVGEVSALHCQAGNNPSRENMARSFPFPQEVGKRAIEFHEYYFAPHEADRKLIYNCHIFTWAVRGVLEIGTFDPNLCWGGTGQPPIETDQYTKVSPDDVVAGEAYCMVASQRPTSMVHSIIALNAKTHLAVRGNKSNMVLGETVTTMEYYERQLGMGAMQLYWMSTAPSVIGTDRWEEVLRHRYKGKPHKAQAKIAKVKDLLSS